MQSALIVHSKSTKYYADLMANHYKNVEFVCVTEPPKIAIKDMRHGKHVTIAVGGGSVIDTAKVLAGSKRCIAIPTTAAGAAMTPYATLWGKDSKVTVPTRVPIMKKDYYGMPKNLPEQVKMNTMYDCIAHAIESNWSKKATQQSRRYANRALMLVDRYLKTNNMDFLIDAGNAAGKAICIAPTNMIHATSYLLTIKDGMTHGHAVGILLPKFAKFMATPIHAIDYPLGFVAEADEIVEGAFKYSKIHDSTEVMTPDKLKEILNG